MNIYQNHVILLNDQVRMEAYQKAIKMAVKPGSVVLDVGCGIGILSMMALKAGAKMVHAIEVESETFELAKKFAKKNGLAGRIVFHKGLSSKIELKEKVDVIISELFGSLGFNENLLSVLIDAKARFLKKGGKVIPEKVSGFLVPCEHKPWNKNISSLKNVCGIDMSPVNMDLDLGVNAWHIKADEFLATPSQFADINIYSTRTDAIKSQIKYKMLRNGVFTGLAGWFETKLFGEVGFSTSPLEKETHWAQAYLPLKETEMVAKEDVIKLHFEIGPEASGLNSSVGYGYNIKARR